ncbi:MAG: 30S ribosomal protein S12 methylthiotransferase RimO [Bacteroidetes bacterium]|nr:30S ribosomal protein S12 methylthiotransferase RimO [Bacteroidota bacterium]
MNLKTKPKQKINIITMGCSKNLVDSEQLMRQLTDKYQVVHDSERDDAEIIIINTCGFIADAKQESIDTILNFTEAKKGGKIKKVYVMGCLSQRYEKELKAEIPDVDAFYGVNDITALLQTLKVDFKKELLGERTLTTPKHYAYLKIAEGCNRNCSFCAIPLIRGKNISKPVEDLVAEAEWLASNGVKELILIAQDLTYYGMDLYKKRKLAELLEKLVAVKGIEWIRLHYAYPAAFPLDVLNVMAKYDKICKYIDIPLQHIDDSLLNSMKRNIDGAKTRDLIKKLRTKVPEISIRTTLIVGYPGETKAKFETLKKFVAENKFERLGVFTYSPEENTSAYLLKDSVSAKVKEQRMAEIMEIQQQISAEINKARIGKTYKTIIDRKEGNYWVGRTEFDSPEVDNEVLIPSTKKLIIGDFYHIEVTNAEDYDLYGKVI